MHIGNCIKSARIAAGLTQKELAEKCEMAEITIRQYENGKREPRQNQLERIADALSITVTDLLLIELMHSPLKNTLDNMPKSEIVDLMNDAIKKAKEGLKKEEEIQYLFKLLNSIGQDKAIEQVELLTKIPEYQKEDE